MPLNKKIKINGGGGQIRTAEPEGADLQSAAFSHFATPPWWLGTESNRRHLELQSSALPTELPSLFKHTIAGAGLEPATSGL